MNRLFNLLLLILFYTSLSSQNEIELRTDGLIVPRTTISAVSNPKEGLLIYDSSTDSFKYYDGSNWNNINGSAGLGAFERVDGEVRQSSPKSDSDAFIFGLDSLPTEPTGSEHFFFFDQSKAAFRGGQQQNKNWVKDSLGFSSFSYGSATLAKGNGAVAFSESQATGKSSFATGLSSAQGEYASSFGFDNIASGDRSAVFGGGSSALGASSIATGEFTSARGLNSSSFGVLTSARGSNSAAFGSGSSTFGTNSAAFGLITNAFGYSSASFGGETNAHGNYSSSFGLFTRAAGQNSMALGQYNDGIVSNNAAVTDSSPLLIVGNGDDDTNRNNALVIRKNGEVSFDNYTFPIGDGTVDQVLATDGSGQLKWRAESDQSATNELQTLTKVDDLVTLSNGGGSFKDEDDWENNNSATYYNSGRVGIGEDSPSGYLHINANDNINSPHLELTDQGTDAFVRIVMNREGIDKNWFNSATTHSTDDASSFYSFIYEDEVGGLQAALRMDGTGHFGIAGFPGTQELKVTGNASKTTAGDWLANSDRRIKTEIKNIDDARDIIKRLRPVKVKYTEEWQQENPDLEDHYYYNFIAQEYQKVFPESVEGSGEYIKGDPREILQIDSYNAQIVTISAVKDLIYENEKMLQRIESQESELVRLKEQIKKLTDLFLSMRD